MSKHITAVERKIYEMAFDAARHGEKWNPGGFILRNQDRLEAYTKGFRDAGCRTTSTPAGYGNLQVALDKMDKDGWTGVVVDGTHYSLPGLFAEFRDIRDLDAWHYSGFYLLFRYDGFGEISFSLEGGRVIRREVLAAN